MNRQLLSSCAAGLLHLAAAAQSPNSTTTPAAAPAGRVPLHTRAAEPGSPAYGTWAAGRDYKASFGDEVTYVPALGRGYPHDQPWTWRTTAVRVGGNDLLAPEAVPAVHAEDYRFVLDRGAVIEAYDVLEHGLEQTFWIRERPAGSGDLTIEGTVTTALRADAGGGGHRDVLFADDAGTALVRYGRAFALDAGGDVLPMATTWDGDRITLRLDAAALERAAFPLLVDPLLSRVPIVTDDATVGDVAVEDSSASYNTLFAITRHFSATDDDVIASLTHPNFNLPATVFADVSQATSAAEPRVAFVAGANRWVIAYQSQNLSTKVMQIRARVHDRQSTKFSGSSIGRLNAPGDHDWRPVVGGTVAGSTGSHALIAFQRDDTGGQQAFADTANSAVLGLLFNAATTSGTFGVPFTIYASSVHDAERPAVNRAAAGGPSFSWLTVCQIYNNAVAGDDWDLVGKKVDQGGTVSGGQWLSRLGETHKMSPVVDGRDGRYCVAYAVAPSTTFGKLGDGLGRQVYAERIDWPHGASSPPGFQHPPQSFASSASRTFVPTGIAFNGESRSHWTLAYRWSYWGSGRLDLVHLGYRAQRIGADEVLFDVAGESAGRAAVAHSDSRVLTVFAYDVAKPAGGYVYGQQMTWPSIAPPSRLGVGCTAAQLSWVGPSFTMPAENQRIGGDLSGPMVTNAPAGALHLLVVATADVFTSIPHPLIDTGCVLLVPLSGPHHVGMMPAATGSNVAWPLPLPESLPELTLRFQDWLLDPAKGKLLSTRSLLVPIAR